MRGIHISSFWLPVRSVGAEDVHKLEFKPEVADAREQAVHLGLVDDLADELCGAGAPHERHAIEGVCQACAEPPTYLDPNPQRRVHVADGPACLRECASRRADFTQCDSSWAAARS
jgi:hypothetical protein